MTNGKLYLADVVEPPIRVVHVWGSHAEMGLAIGQLLRDEIPTFIERMIDYIDSLVAGLLKEYLHWPEDVSKAVVRKLLLVALHTTRDLTRPYTPQHFDEEIEGIARGAAMDENLLQDFNQFPELVKSACTIIGAWALLWLLVRCKYCTVICDLFIMYLPIILLVNGKIVQYFSIICIQYNGKTCIINLFLREFYLQSIYWSTVVVVY